MTFSADSSFVVRLYNSATPSAELDTIHRYLDDSKKIVVLSELAKIEVLNVLLRRGESEGARDFAEDLAEGTRVRMHTTNWSKAFQTAESLARRFSRKLKPGAHDLVLVAAAVTMGATWFLSYDRESNQRVLAVAAGLKVWPPLDKHEKGIVRTATE